MNEERNTHGDQLEQLRIEHAARPEDADVATKLAQAYADRGWLNEAMELFRECIKKNENSYSLLLEYGNVCYKHQDLAEAQSVFKRLTALKPLRVEGWNNLGIVQLSAGEDDAAMASFKKVLELEPDNAGAMLNLGNCFDRKGMHDKARELFEKVVAAKRDFADGWFNLGNACCAMGDFDAAITAYEKAVRSQREFPSALKNMGFAYERKGDIGNALSCYLTALDLNKADAGLYVNIANMYVNRKKFDEAKKMYLQAVRLSPRESAGWMGLRDIALVKGDIESYMKSTVAVVQRLDQGELAQSLLVLRELGHADRVDELLGRVDALDAHGDELDAERMLAYARKPDKCCVASALYRRLSQTGHPSAHVRSCLAHAAFDKGEFDAACSHLESMTKRSMPENRLLWKTCIALKQWQKAERLLWSFLEDHDDCFDAYFYLAVIKAHTDDAASARQHLQRAFETGFTDLDAIEEFPKLKVIYSTIHTKYTKKD